MWWERLNAVISSTNQLNKWEVDSERYTRRLVHKLSTCLLKLVQTPQRSSQIFGFPFWPGIQSLFLDVFQWVTPCRFLWLNDCFILIIVMSISRYSRHVIIDNRHTKWGLGFSSSSLGDAAYGNRHYEIRPKWPFALPKKGFSRALSGNRFYQS